jgi:hypothetical protein
MLDCWWGEVMKFRCLVVPVALAAAAFGISQAHEEGGGPSKETLFGTSPFPVVASPPESFTSPELPLLGHLGLPGPGADLWAHKNVAYLGSWAGATVGVKMVDIADPARPALIGTLPLRPGTSYEDVMVISADTPAFEGDLLAVGLQRDTQGVEFWDVTDPRRPRLLSFLPTAGRPGVHELYLLQRGNRILALLATLTPGLRIVDVTDPTRPVLLATWQLQAALNINPQVGAEYPSSFNHSVSASADGTIAYLSYWDAGAVMLDISDPARPRFLGRTLNPVSEEGNTHSAVEADGGRLLITTDEDFDPTPAANTVRVTAPASLARLHPGIELAFTRQLVDTGPIRGEVVYAGSALPGTDFRVDPRGKIALLDPGATVDQWREQVLRAQAAGAVAVLFSQRPRRDGKPDARITLPGVGMLPEVAEPIKGALAAGQKVEVELTAGTSTWGFLRLWDIQDRANPVQVGTFATPATRQYPLPRPGWFSVHNPLVRGNRLYASWYSDGVRVLDITDPAQPREIGHYVPPFDPGTPQRFGQFPLVWGVVEHNGLVLLSDMQSGLWVLRDVPR